MELKDIKAIIDLMKENDLSIFEMEKDGFRLKLEKAASGQAVVSTASSPSHKGAVPTMQTAAAQEAQVEERAEKSSLKEIVSPMVGTFYRAGAPDAAPFVDVGASVTEDTVVCIIEAMKVMNEIKAETSGTIAEIVAENGKPVQFGQALFRVR